MKLIAFAGPAGAGKTTCAQHLVRDHQFERVSFAGPLYDMLEAGGFGRPKTLEEKQAIIPGLGVTWRHAAQTLGTEWGRVCLDENIWTKLLIKRLLPKGLYVIDDLRFENEADVVRGLGGLIVHITGRQGAIPADAKAHASEQGIAAAPGDYYLPNDAPLETLYVLLNRLASVG